MERSGIYASHRAHAMPKIARNDHQTRNVADSQTGTNEQSPCEHPEQPRATAQTTPRHRLPDRSPWHAHTQKPPIRSPNPAKTSKTCAQIIEAALAEFMQQGHAAATMGNIAQHAGLAKGTLYTCFENKEALFLGLIEQVVKGPLSEVEKQPIREKELVVDHFRRTLLPAMRTMEMTGRASVAHLILAEGAKFPFLIEAYRREVHAPFLAHIRHHARSAFQRGEVGDDTLAQHPHLLVGPRWIGMIHNGILDPEHPIDGSTLCESQLRMLFCPPCESSSVPVNSVHS